MAERVSDGGERHGRASEHDHHDHAHHDHDHHDHAHGGHDHHHDLRRSPMKRLVWAFVITAAFMLVEAFVGWWSKSLALLADAGHMLADAAALALAIGAQWIASQARTRRAEVLAAFANGVALALTAIWIFIEAVSRWKAPPAIRGEWMTATAVVGLFVNLGSAAMLSLGAHGHNVNTRGALAHVLTDAIGSVGAILAGVLVLSFGWNRADPLISAAIGVLVLWGGYRLVRETSRVLMEGTPVEIDLEHVEDTIRGVPGVVDLHDLHVWSISDDFDVLTVHVVIARGYHGTDVAAAVGRRVREVHGLAHSTIQPEPLHQEQLITLGRRPSPS